MKNRLVLVAALLALLQVSALAQGRGMRSPEERAKQLKEQLTLTDDQVVKVKKIFEDGQKQAMDMMGSNMGDRAAMREVMMKITAKQDSLIEKLLTKEQTAKYTTVKKEREERMRQFQRGQ